jgi:hypothetical protein
MTRDLRALPADHFAKPSIMINISTFYGFLVTERKTWVGIELDEEQENTHCR